MVLKKALTASGTTWLVLASFFLGMGWVVDNEAQGSAPSAKSEMGKAVGMRPEPIQRRGGRGDDGCPQVATGVRGLCFCRSLPSSEGAIWGALEGLNPDERMNARIELELLNEASEAARSHGRKVEEAWNSGRHEEALRLFRSMGELTNLIEVGLGISWREPIRLGGTDWGNDVRVSARDSVYQISLDSHGATGHLFVALLYPGDGMWRWSVNLSTDGGETWRETYEWGAPWQMRDMDATVLTGYFYVGYAATSSQNQIRMQRFLATDARRDPDYPIQTVYSGPPRVMDIALCSNADQYEDRIYCTTILSDSTLLGWWSDDAALAWQQFGSSPREAVRGLDVSWNEGFTDYSLWASYVSSADSVEVVAVRDSDDNWYSRGTLDYAGPPDWTRWTSIGAWGDVVITVFEHLGGGVVRAKYWATYNSGSNWLSGVWGDTLQYTWTPNVTCRRGDGMGGVYQGGGTGDVFFTWSDYSLPPPTWTPAVDVSEYSSDLWYRPAIECLGGGVYGTVYVSFPGGYAYFDRSDRVGAEERPDTRGQRPEARLGQNSPNPFTHRTTVTYHVAPRHGDTGKRRHGDRSTYQLVNLSVYDVTGRLVRTLLNGLKEPGCHAVAWDGKGLSGRDVAGGVYFYRLTAGDFRDTRKAVLVR